MKQHSPKIDAQLKRIGKRIRELRKQKYSSYEKFAFTHDMNRVTYGRIENGYDLHMSNFLKVTNALEISLQDFFSEGFEDLGQDKNLKK